MVVGCRCSLALPVPLTCWDWHGCVGVAVLWWHGYVFGSLPMLWVHRVPVGGLSPELSRI